MVCTKRVATCADISWQRKISRKDPGEEPNVLDLDEDAEELPEYV